MKEDVLEQIAEDYLKLKGYFTIHNIRFKPSHTHRDYNSRADSVNSDIDVIGYNPRLAGAARVMVVGCKSWQSGFSPEQWVRDANTTKEFAGRESWKFFRELVNPKWTEAFLEVIGELAGQTEFTHVTAVTWIKGDKACWENHKPFRAALGGNPLRLLPLQEMVDFITKEISQTPAASDIGRLIQLLKAAEILK